MIFFTAMATSDFVTPTYENLGKYQPRNPFWVILKKKKEKKNQKKIEKKIEKKNFFRQKSKIFEGAENFFSPIRAHSVPQNAVLWFFRGEKRKFRRKIPLGGHFGGFWAILEKSIFFRFWGSKSP